MALTPEQRNQILAAVKKARDEGRPLFPSKKPAAKMTPEQEKAFALQMAKLGGKIR